MGDNSTGGNAKQTDKSMVLIYNAKKDEVIFLTDGATRFDRAQTMIVPDNYTGDEVECFISFISEDGDTVSNSKHLGSVTVA